MKRATPVVISVIITTLLLSFGALENVRTSVCHIQVLHLKMILLFFVKFKYFTTSKFLRAYADSYLEKEPEKVSPT